MSAGERLALALRLSAELRAVTADGVRLRHPDYDAATIERAARRLWLGAEVFRAVFPEPSPVEP